MSESITLGYLQRRDQAREEAYNLWMRTPSSPEAPDTSREGQRLRITQLVEDIAPVYGVDPTLVLSMIEQESRYNPKAVGSSGEKGLMQLMPATARRFGVQDPFDPADNIRGGVRYLAYLQKLYPGDTAKQLAGYNAGEGAVQAYGGVPPYPGTQHYVATVMTTYQGGQPYVGKEEQKALRGEVGEALTTLPPRSERLESPAGAQERAVTGTLPPAGVQEGTTVQVTPGRLGPARQPMVPVTEEEAAIFEGSYTPPTAVEVEPGRLEQQRQPLSPVLGPGLEPGLEEPLAQRLPVRMAQGAVRAVANVLSALPAFEAFVGIQTPFGNTAQDAALALEEAARGLEPSGQETGLVDRLAETAGGQMAFFAAGVAGNQALQFITAAAPKIVRAIGLTPAAISAVTEAGAEASQTYEALRPLVGDEQAAKRANTVFWRNVWLLTVTNKLGIFGGAEKPLGRVLAGGAMEGVQEVVQYDVQRRAFWVPASHPKAAELVALGWQRDGERVQQPFAVGAAAEAGVLGALMGGGMAGLAGEIGTPRPEGPVPEREAPATEPPALAQSVVREGLGTGTPGALLRLYHGTTRDFAAFNPQRADADALFGPGLYFTDTPEVASGYASGEGGNVRPVYLDIRRPLVLQMFEEVPMDAALREPITALAAQVPRGDSLRPVDVADYTNMDAYSLLADAFGDLRQANDWLKQQGYDGIQHEGGVLTGGTRHQVWIAFEPSQVIPAYSAAARPDLPPWLAQVRASLPSEQGGIRLPQFPLGLSYLQNERGALGRGKREALRGTGAGAVGAGATSFQRFVDTMGSQLEGLTRAERQQVYKNAKAYLVRQNVKAEEGLPQTAGLLELFERGESSKDWYVGAREELERLLTRFGSPEDLELFVRLIGATSPSVRVAANIDNALRVYLAYKAGEPIEARRTAPQLMSTHMPNVERALAGETIQGPKVGNFARNILGDAQAVTVDSWMMKIWGYSGEQAPTTNQYRMISQWVTDLAAERGVTPREMQAALWVGYKLSHQLAGERLEEITLPLSTLVKNRLGTHMERLQQRYPTLADQLGRMNERGQIELVTMMELAQTLVGAGLGAAIGDTDEEQLLGVLAGGTLGALLSPRILRRLLRRMRADLPKNVSGFPIGTHGILPSEQGGIRLPQFPQQPSPPKAPTLAEGAAGLEASRFRDAQGRWRIPLKDMPAEELEIQDFIRQQGGIRLEGEELHGELQALISRRETGTPGLQNNVSGRSLQAMAERAQEFGFTATADKTSLLEALDRSVRQGVQVYSMAATGHIPLIEDPTTRALYHEVVDLAETYRSRVETQRRGTRPREAVHAEGLERLQEGSWTLDDMLEIPPGTLLDDTLTSATVQAVFRMGGLIQTKAREFVESGAGVGSPEEKSFLQGMGLMAEVEPILQGLLAEPARSLGILNDPLSPMNRFLRQFQPQLASMGEQASLQLARRVMAFETPEQAAKAVQQLTKPGLGDMLLEVWINGMLSSPRTQLVNAVSNALTAGWAIPERLVAGIFGSLLPGGEVSPGEVTAQWWGLTQGMREGWKLAWQVIRTGERDPAVGVGTTKQETRYPVAVTAQNVGLDPDSVLGQMFDFWAEYIGLGSGGRLPTRGLLATDEFFRAVNYRMELAALAYRKARSLGRTPQERQALYTDVLTSPDAADMRQAAEQFSLVQTFQRELDPQSWGGRMQNLAGATATLPGGITLPVGRALLPFVRTPVNLARWATERTLLGAFYQEMLSDLAAGGARRDLAAAKVTLGSLTMAAVAGLAYSGILTGRGPEDDDMRAALTRLGWQPYSVKIGDTYIGYDRFDPFGLLLGMTADIVQVAGDHSLDTTSKLIAAPFFAVARGLTSKTYMSSLARFFDAVSPQAFTKPEQALRGVQRYFQSQFASVVPASVATATQLLDPWDRELWGIFDGALERTPWTQKGLPLKRDRWGFPKLLGWGFDDSWVTRLGRSVTPLTISQAQQSPIDDEMRQQHITLGMPSKSFLPRTDMITEFLGDPLTAPQLTPAQYERYVLYSAANGDELQRLGLDYPRDPLRQLTRGAGALVRQTPPQAAMSLVDVLDWLITTPHYLAQSEGPGGGRERIIREVAVEYQDMARAIMLARDPELKVRYDAAVKLRALQQVSPAQRERVEERYDRAQERRDQRLQIGR